MVQRKDYWNCYCEKELSELEIEDECSWVDAFEGGTSPPLRGGERMKIIGPLKTAYDPIFAEFSNLNKYKMHLLPIKSA